MTEATITKDKLQTFYDFSQYIDKIDYSSYTLQYPPPFILKDQFEKQDFSTSFINMTEGT